MQIPCMRLEYLHTLIHILIIQSGYHYAHVMIAKLLSWLLVTMMTSSNGNIFRVTGRLCGEFTGYRWIPRTKACVAELWSAPE